MSEVTEVKNKMIGNWDEEVVKKESKPEDRRKSLYLDTKAGGQFRVRLIGAWVKCLKRFDPYKATYQEDEQNTDPAYCAGFRPATKRCAINIIDRADGKIKMLEKGWSVFKHFKNYKMVTGKDPASVNDGPDFVITVTIPASGKASDTEYGVTSLERTPLTEAEKTMIREQKLFPLTEIYKTTPASKMKEMWDALSPEKRIPPVLKNKEGKEYTRKAISQSKPIEEKMTDSPAIPENSFNDNSGGDGEDSTNLF